METLQIIKNNSEKQMHDEFKDEVLVQSRRDFLSKHSDKICNELLEDPE